jgi:very-short-patch-repair endonuclease
MNDMPEAPQISLVYDQSINYAFQQNAVPVIKELRFCNDGAARKNLIIRITTEPSFAEPVELRLQGIDAAGEFRVAPLDIKLSPDFLAKLNEKVSGWLKCEVVDGDSVICSRTDPISLLARNEWCGLVALPEILAAFILPNDAAVMTILNRGAELLREHTGRSAFNGYQDKNHKRAWEQVAAIYKAVAELGIRYIVAPASFENTGQKVRSPADILAQRFANCLDLSLLFCACCEQVGLHPLVLMHEGHAYTGCWLEERTLPEPSSEDLQHIRKLVTDEVMTVFEATTATDENPGTLRDAELLAQPHLLGKKPFRLALDVRRSRVARIHPLPIPNQPMAAAGNGGSNGGPAPVAGIGEREFAEPMNVTSSGSVKPATRIDQWKSRLLDLSLRNRLLNFRKTKTTIRILSAAPDRVEDELAAERELSLRPRPKVMSEDDPRNEVAYTRQQRADALTEHLIDELKHGRLHTHLDETEHARRLTELYRSARNAIEENGTNTLFAAVGFLEWRETEHSDRTFQAPLLLVPVELKRKSVLEGFSLRRIDEETRLNVTLMEMLRQHFQKDIAGLDPLPEDDSGVDVALVFRIFREAVRDLPGWEVKTEVWLGQFSFTKFLLWKDLADRLEDLTRNRVVNHLVNEAGTPYPNPDGDIRPEQLDDEFHPRDIFCPRSADSSQLAAVMAAAAGHDFVLEGPPGTGKSQTIANIIAHCLANEKRVLFVAEKRAALDVVYRRLREEGLEPFCLELHSNKTGKADVVAQFDRSLRFIADSSATDWEHRAAELERLRDALNGYARALHRRHPCGLSAHHCLDYLLPRQQEPTVRLESWPSILTTPRETLDRAREVAGLLQQRSRPFMPLAGHPLTLLACEDWSPAWADRMPDRMREIGKQIESATAALNDLRAWLHCPDSTASRADMVNLVALVDSLLAPEPVGPAFATTPWNQLEADLQNWIALVQERAELRIKIKVILDGSALQSDTHNGLACEEWSSSVAQRIFERIREFGAVINTAEEASRNLRTWLSYSSTTASRVQLIHLQSLAKHLLTLQPVGPGFATTPWDELGAHLDEWIALSQERADLRAKLILLIKEQPQSRVLGTMPDQLRRMDCEEWSSEVAERIFNSISEFSGLVKDASKATHDLHEWLRLPRTADSRTELVNLVELVDCLLLPLPVGPAFATALWNDIVSALDDWITLARERVDLRSKLQGYDEAKLLALNIEHLQQRWESAQTSWFLIKWIRTDEVRRQLRTARPDKKRPDAAEVAAILKIARRLNAIKASFASAEQAAKSYLGQNWKNGEPDPEMMDQIRAWGETLHARMVVTAGDDLVWLDQLRRLLSGLFKDGPATYAPETTVGDLLSRYRDAITHFDDALNDLNAEICFRRSPLDSAPDHLAAVATASVEFLQIATRLREIDSNIATSAPIAQACLGVIWNKGEPSADALTVARGWGETLHNLITTCAIDNLTSLNEVRQSLASSLNTQACGERRHAHMVETGGNDLNWPHHTRQLLAGIFGGGSSAYAVGTPFEERLSRYCNAINQLEVGFDLLNAEIGLQLKPLEDSTDYISALSTTLDNFLKIVMRLRTINSSLAMASPGAQACLGVLWLKGEPSADALAKARDWGQTLHARMLACAGDDLVWLGQLRQSLASLFGEGPEIYAAGTTIGNRLTHFRETQSEFNAAFDTFVGEVRLRREHLDVAPDYFFEIQSSLRQILSAWSQIREWCFWQKVRNEGAGLGLLPVITQLESADGETLDIPGLFERSFRRDLFFATVESEASLREFFGQEHNERIERFRDVDERKAGLAREIIRARLAAGIPRDQGRNDVPKLEIGLLRREIAKKMRHIPVRQLLNRIPNLLPRLKPCVLMSPLSVAQYLDASHAVFDVVIFDEASQIPVWDAIGAIARGQQLIVVGDPKQLPPTNFFNSAGDDDDDLAPEEFKDLESILDELMSHELRRKRLQWHYRSRHEGLITFSNRQYYENELLTFPSAETALGGVKFRHLPEARYDKGKSRTNRGEADALVAELVARLRANDGPRRSFGVVTFSLAQQQLIENLLDEERRKYPEIELHFSDEPPVEGEPVFIKNLENVQGDERDVIFFSICYGADENGRVAMNFGPLNRDGGERRLNVAITRAKHEVVVFSGLRADQIDLTRTRARGVRDLKYFLDYAERGPGALTAVNSVSGDGEAESEFERMVADRLRAAGYEVHHQVGCSGYRIDLGILDPANAGKYQLGVECDGATYHRAATARDRDKLRQAVLEGLGWTLYRIWSTDWWHDSEKEMNKLLSFIESLLKAE